MRKTADDRTHAAVCRETAWSDPRALATATGAVFAGLGRITQMVSQDGTSTYGVFDRRIGRKIDTTAPFNMADAVIERYVLDDIHNGLASADGGNVVLDFVDPDGSGAQPLALAKRYLYGEAVDQLFAQEDLSKTLGDAARNLWPLVDQLGTVRDLAKQDGTIAAHYKYDSFGRVTYGDTSKTRYLFTSREFDPATGLQYNRARWYDPRVGRWISEDPLGFVAGDGNIVRYVGNRVTIEADPSGLQPPNTTVPTLPFDPRYSSIPELPWPGARNPGGPPRREVLRGIAVFSEGSFMSADGQPAPRPPFDRRRGASTGEYGVEVIPPGWFFGVSGAGPCVGAIFIPPDRGLPTYVFHFDQTSNIRAAFQHAGVITRELPGYRVVINGGESHGVGLLHDVIEMIRSEFRFPIVGWVPGTSVFVDGAGKIWYAHPNTSPTDEYYR